MRQSQAAALFDRCAFWFRTTTVISLPACRRSSRRCVRWRDHRHRARAEPQRRQQFADAVAPLSVQRGSTVSSFVNGTPTDCVHIALTGLLEHRPDLVVSGINNGQNMGDDTIYSGTVAAAMEGFVFGVPCDRLLAGRQGLRASRRRRRDWPRIVGRICAPATERPCLLNVNVPNLPVTRQAASSSRGWARHPCRAGDPQHESARRADLLGWPRLAKRLDASPGTDFHAIAERLRFGDAAAGRSHDIRAIAAGRDWLKAPPA